MGQARPYNRSPMLQYFSMPNGRESEDGYARSRLEMVNIQLRNRGVDDERVLAVMSRVPRERFVLPSDEASAYEDQAMPIQAGQTISQPYIVGLMTQLLDVQPHHRVLEVGTGSGYQTAILASLARHVYSIERLSVLSELAAGRLRELGMDNVTLVVDDGSLGWPREAPFDRIMVTAGAPSVPPALIEQLADGGRLVVPVGGEGQQTLTLVERAGTTTIERPGIACRFVPLIGKAGWEGSDRRQ